MRFGLRSVFFLASALAVVVAVACDDGGPSNDVSVMPDGGHSSITPDAQAADAETAAPTTTMRLAHLAPGVGPVDFCYQGAKKGTFVGPVVGGAPPIGDAGMDASDADAEAGTFLDAATPDAPQSPPPDAASDAAPSDAGDAPPLPASYRTVSRYYDLQAAGPITIAVVPAGATSCATPIAIGDVTLDPGKLSTVALVARFVDGGVEPTIVAFTDDHTTAPQAVRVRVIHAALGKRDLAGKGPLAVRAVAAKTTVLADDVEPRRAASASAVAAVDGLGYVTAAPIPGPVAIAVGPADADGGFDPWQSKPANLWLTGGSLHTAFVLTGTPDHAFEVLWCDDTTTTGDQMTCSVVR